MLKYFPKINTGNIWSLEIWVDTQNTETVLTFLPFVTGRMILYSMKSSYLQMMPASWSVCCYHFPPTYLAQFQSQFILPLKNFFYLSCLQKVITEHFGTIPNFQIEWGRTGAQRMRRIHYAHYWILGGEDGLSLIH